MPRFKDYDYNQGKFLPVSFEKQILPGTFEYSLNALIDDELDLSIFDGLYTNDEGGRPAYYPGILLKIVLLAYSHGITSSRRIASMCEDNVVFMAISADSRPHFTTIADFISSCHEEIGLLFRQVVLVCDELGLIGGEMFAIDGCKLLSNASKEWSGTLSDLEKKRKKLDRAVRRILKKHREADLNEVDEDIEEREKRQVKKLRQASRKIQDFLGKSEEKIGASGKEIQSNITDNESAKMKTSHGVIQGYIGVAGVDAKHQVVVHAEAHGQPQEHQLLEPTVEGIREVLERDGSKKNALIGAKVIVDSGYHSRKNVEYLEKQKLDGYVADTGYRSRDARFQTAARHRPNEGDNSNKRFTGDDFDYDLKKRTCRCPAGKSMWLRCARVKIGNTEFNVHLDGYNMLPYFTGQVEEGPRKEMFYFTDDGQLSALRYGQWKVMFTEQRGHGMEVWQEPYVTLRFPKLFNLRRDPYERADWESGAYETWRFERIYLLTPAAAFVGQFIGTFKEYPPRQKPGSFNLDHVLESLQKETGGAN